MLWNYPVPSYLFAVAAAAAVLVLLFAGTLRRSASRVVTAAVVATAFIAGMLLLPSENHLMGDGITHLNSGDRWFSATEPLDVLVHHVGYLLTGSMLASYRLIAFFAGLFFLFALYRLSLLGRTDIEKAIIPSAFFVTATLQFYFGYVESYTLLHLFTTYYIYFAWRDLARNQSSCWPLIFFLLATLSHFSGIVLLPSLLYLYRGKLTQSLKYLVILLLALGAVVAWQVNPSIILVPVTANSFSTYSLFSAAHLLDLLNELLLVSPAFFLAIFGRRCDKPVKFALLALAGGLVFAIVVDPKIGAFRDWDLLLIFSVPLAALVALRAPRRKITLVILALIFVLRIVPWILFNSSLQLEYVKKVLADDIHYSQDYDNGYRLQSWGVFLQESNDFAGAAEVYIKRLEYQPDDVRTLTMLVPTLFQLGRFGEAHERCLQGLRVDPGNVNFLYKAIYTAFRIGDLEAALELLRGSPADFLNTVAAARLYAGIVGAQGRHEEAVALAKRCPLEDKDGYLPYMLARSSIAVGDYQFAASLIASAVELDPENEEYRRLADSLRKLDNH